MPLPRRSWTRVLLTRSTGHDGLPPLDNRADEAVIAAARARVRDLESLEGTLPQGGCLLWANHSGGSWPAELLRIWSALEGPVQLLGGAGSWSPGLHLRLLPATREGLQRARTDLPVLVLPGGTVATTLPDRRRNWGRSAPESTPLLSWAQARGLPVVPVATFGDHHRRLLPGRGTRMRSRLGKVRRTWDPAALEQHLQDELEVLERRVRRAKVGKWVNKKG